MNALHGPPWRARRLLRRCLAAFGTAATVATLGALAASAALLVGAWRSATLVVAVALGG